MRWKAIALAAVVLAGAGSTESCSSATTVEGDKCAEGRGVWMQDDNDEWMEETHVTVRICVAEGGRVLDIEVD